MTLQKYEKRIQLAKYNLRSHLLKAKSRLEKAEQIANIIENINAKEHIINAINEIDKILNSIAL
jgi:uncharacterized protein with PhoU and TrkA domain